MYESQNDTFEKNNTLYQLHTYRNYTSSLAALKGYQKMILCGIVS